MSDPMDQPPADHGSDRYDYVEIVGAPPGVAPHGPWFDALLAQACPDCRANVFLYWRPDLADRREALAESRRPWNVQLAHDDTCPWLAKREVNER